MKQFRILVLLIFILPIIFSCQKKTTEPHVKPVVATPALSPAGGTYSNMQSVTISCSTVGASILYSVDGTEPTPSSILYTNPVNISSTATLKARAFKTDWDASEIATANYEINIPPDTVDTPEINPHGGIYTEAQNVSMFCTTSGALICYTTDGTDPDIYSAHYNDSIEISVSCTVKARAFKSGMIDSDIALAEYTINIPPDPMVLVPGGSFTMGRTVGSGASDELPTHQVTLSSFYISKYEVTQAEWKAVMENNPAQFNSDTTRPVDSVSWYAVLVYCNKKSILDGRTPVYSISSFTNPDDWGSIPTSNSAVWNNVSCNWTANGYRMPTEAEWEYAARGAQSTPDYVYSGSNNVDAVAWYFLNSNNSTHPVGLKQPNSLGIYDMSGNVWEWCWDWLDSYNSASVQNPTGPESGVSKILRGGAWDANDDDGRRIASRGWWVPYYYNNNGGVRIVRANVFRSIK